MVGTVEDSGSTQARGLDQRRRVSMPDITGPRDKLTGALLRDDFVGMLQAEMLGGLDTAAMIVLGIDGTTTVNDTLGYEVGDQVLSTLCARLLSSVRSCDVVCRLSGDVFAVYSPGLDTALAADVAVRLQQAITGPIEIAEGSIRVTVSIGIASLDRAVDAETLLVNADVALKAAKATGHGNAERFDAVLEAQVDGQRALVADLQLALDQNELITGLEPIAQMPSGEVVGLQATVSWLHPERGVIDRDEFVGVAETIGRIGDVERAVVDLAVQQWSGADVGARTAVSISGTSLCDENHIELLLNQIESQGKHRDLIVEVSETAVRDGGQQAINNLNRLRRAGVGIMLDDFGAEVGSLHTLHSFAFDGVKVHPRLLGNDPLKSESVGSAIYAAAAVLGFDVIHTGVDTESHLETLDHLNDQLHLGGYYAQGRAVSRLAQAA